MNTEMKLSFMLLAGIAGAIIIALIALPALAGDTYIISRSGGGGNETTQCFNVGNGTVIVKQSLSGNCYIKTLVGSSDISISNGTNTITIDYNGSSSESTQCINVGSQTVIIKNSTAGNCYVKSFTTGKGLTISNGTNTITIATNFVNGTGISITGTGAQTITNTGVISNSCTSPISCSGTNPSTISCPTCSTTNPTWIILANVSASGGSTSITMSNFTSYKYLEVVIHYTSQTSSSVWGLRFNSDSGANYDCRSSLNGASDTTSNNQSAGNSMHTSSTDQNVFYIADIDNFASEKKNIKFDIGTDQTAGTAPDRREGWCKWNNTTNQINNMSWVRLSGTGTITSANNMVVLGHN